MAANASASEASFYSNLSFSSTTTTSTSTTPGSLDCWHCSLVSYKVSYLSAEAMHHFAGYVLPGIIFAILGLRWAALLVIEWSSRLILSPDDGNVGGRRSGKDGNSRVCFLNDAFSNLPWEGIIKLILTGLGIVVSVVAASPQQDQDDSEYVSNIRYATVYLFFALSGLMDIVVYYCGYSVLPEGIQSFILSLAFSVEGVMFSMRLRFEGYLEQHIHILLVVAIFTCALTCALEVLYDNRLVKFCRSYLCLLQGTWLMHGGFIMQGSGTAESSTYPDSLEWVSILFSWHVAGNFILFVTSLLVARHMAIKSKSSPDSCCCFLVSLTADLEYGGGTGGSSTPTSSNHHHHNSFHSPATVQTNVSPATVSPAVNKVGLPTHLSYIQAKQLPTPPPSSLSQMTTSGTKTTGSSRYQYPLPPHPDEDLSRASSVMQQTEGSSPVIVEAVPRDNLVMSEEYRTLSREDELRASIKLKESSLI